MSDHAHPRFRWLERGDGEPVVLLHGLMGHMDHWDEALDALAPVARVLAPELPLLDGGFESAPLAGLAAYVRRFLDALSLPRAVVGGNSLGGHLALALALAYPERVSGLILTGSSGLFERSFTRGVPHRPGAEYVREKMAEVFFDPALVTDAWVASVRRTLSTRVTARRVVRLARAARASTIEPLLGRIGAPALLVWGSDDRVTPLEVAERFRRLLRRSELVVLPRCGHAPMLEQPDVFGRVVRHWLVETRAARDAATGVESLR